MDRNSIYTFIDAIIAAGGVYIIYLAARMMKSGVLSQNGLMSKDVNIKKCKDVAGYIRFMGPKQLLFGVILLLCGAAGLAHDFTGLLDGSVYVVCMVVVVIYLIYYTVQSKKAMQLFW